MEKLIEIITKRLERGWDVIKRHWTLAGALVAIGAILGWIVADHILRDEIAGAHELRDVYKNCLTTGISTPSCQALAKDAPKPPTTSQKAQINPTQALTNKQADDSANRAEAVKKAAQSMLDIVNHRDTEMLFLAGQDILYKWKSNIINGESDGLEGTLKDYREVIENTLREFEKNRQNSVDKEELYKYTNPSFKDGLEKSVMSMRYYIHECNISKKSHNKCIEDILPYANQLSENVESASVWLTKMRQGLSRISMGFPPT